LAVTYGIIRVTAPRRASGVVTFEGGLVIVDDGRPTVVPWTQVLSIRRKITEYYTIGSRQKARRTAFDITVEIDGRPPYKITDQFQGVEALTARIESEVTNWRLPEAVRRVRQGETLRFGPLGVGPHGIDNGRQTLPFSSVRDVEVADGRLTVRIHGPRPSWSSHAVADIPNVSVFLALVQSLASGAG
jgi:hypothetical protein